jgi:hypothetical protein
MYVQKVTRGMLNFPPPPPPTIAGDIFLGGCWLGGGCVWCVVWRVVLRLYNFFYFFVVVLSGLVVFGGCGVVYEWGRG